MRQNKNHDYDIAAYVWPAYTGDEIRTLMFWPEGMGEWQSVKNSQKKYPGHTWPRKPLWGYVNEADPYVMEMQINCALDHNVNVFIYDWYWYDNRPFLENCLNDGFLKANNSNDMKFYLMWANHSVTSTWDKRISHDFSNIIWDGAVSRPVFERLAIRLIEKYFKLDNYYTIDGKPVFMFYDVENLIRGLGGIKETRQALDWFREEAIRRGLKGLHLQLTMWSQHVKNISGVDGNRLMKPSEIIKEVKFDSMTHYQFVHFVNIDRDYLEILEDVKKEWESLKEYDIPYYPHISVGWDNNPRFQDFRPGVVKNNSPENIEKAFRMAKEYIDGQNLARPLITVNSWNEWTETSYLQPDNIYGYGYLEAIKRVFS